ncbi:transcription initiation factor TFIID subunit 2 [Nematocida sp. AWRm80]|nr:transcription initiation factor TFIID subunit 2 [Nematocida sp. AWRm80]
MSVIKQKNILYINPETKVYSGSSIFTITETDSEDTLDIHSSALEILRVEEEQVEEEKKKWVQVQGNKIGKGVSRVRVLFKEGENNQGIDFYSSGKYTEFIGVNIQGTDSYLFPTLDNERCSIEMVYIVPSIQELSVVSSGTLAGVYEGGSTKTYHYKLEDARPEEVIFCGGVLEESTLGKASVFVPQFLQERFAAGTKECLELIKSSLSLLATALDYKLPLERMYLVFCLNEIDLYNGKNCAIVNVSQIMMPEAIDQCFTTVKMITRIIAQQYFGVYSYPISPLDHWMYTGLAEHLSMYLIEIFLGVNEVKYTLNKNIEYVHREDIEEPPLSSVHRERSSFTKGFFIKKSGAVIRILENNLTRAFMQKIIKEVLELRNPSTQDLIRVVKGITGKDVRTLFDSYVYKAGIPTVNAQVEQNTRTGGFSIILKQKCHSVHPEANKHVTGNICVRVCETDSVMDHVLFLGATTISHEIVSHQKTQRRKQKGDEACSLLWVRIDPELEWLKVATVEQADYMFSELLVNEKDVYGQMEALSGMQKNPCESICAVLEKVLGDPQVFYKVSVAAGILLAKSVNEESGYFGFQRVVQFFISNYCIHNTTIVKTNDFSQFRSYFMQKNIAASMSLCQLDATKSLGGRTIRAKNVVSAFLLNLMRYNDNTGNAFEDSFYLADVITALSIALCSDAYLDATPFIQEIERFRKKDLLFPSHQNTVTCASIKALTRLALQGHLSLSKDSLLAYSEKDNFYKVRMAAYESILLLYPLELASFLLERVQIESRLVRLYLLRSICNTIKCANLVNYSIFLSHTEDISRIREIYQKDPEIQEICTEILVLLTETTEIFVGRTQEEYTVHNLSSDEMDAPMAITKLTIKLCKPLILRVNLLSLPLDHLQSMKENQVEAVPYIESDPDLEVKVPTQEEIDQAYQIDEHKTKYLLDYPSEYGLALLLEDLKSNKARSYIVQNAKKPQPEVSFVLHTFNDLPLDNISNIPTYHTDVTSLFNAAPEPSTSQVSVATPLTPTIESYHDKSSSPVKQSRTQIDAPVHYSDSEIYSSVLSKGSISSTRVFQGGSSTSTSPLKRAHKQMHNPLQPLRKLPARKTIQLIKESVLRNPIELNNQVSEVFREYFSTAQYDTSAYNTVKYFQIAFEREYSSTVQLSNQPFHKIDSEPSSNGTSGWLILDSFLGYMLEQDTYGIFSNPVDIEKFKPYKYLEIVRRPLDLQTIRTSIQQNNYLMVECVLYDIIQVFNNCMVYNQKDSSIFQEAQRLRKIAIEKIPEITVQFKEEIRFTDSLQLMTSQLFTPEYQIFREKVDPQQYNQYYSMVKQPITLSIIEERVKQNYYKNLVHFEADVQKICTASTLYNDTFSEITKLSKKLAQETHNLIKRFFPWYKSLYSKRSTTTARPKAPVKRHKPSSKALQANKVSSQKKSA